MPRAPSFILRCVVVASTSSLLLGSDCLGYYPPAIDAALDAPSFDSPPPDAPLACEGATDVTMGGVFSGNTCTGFDQVELSCGTGGTQEQWFVIDGTACFDYEWAVAPAGFAVSVAPLAPRPGCWPTPPPASAPGCYRGLLHNVDGCAGSGTSHIVVERTDGGCGPFSLRVMATPVPDGG